MSEVISIFDKKDKKEEEQKDEAETTAEFEAVMAKNKAKQEKLAKERANTNKSVLRSYRLKT